VRELAGVGRLQRRLDRRHRRHARQTRHEIIRRRAQLGASERAAGTLDQHLLSGALGRELTRQHLLGAVRVTDAELLVLIVTTPAAEPTANATSTNANQPRTVALRWAALLRAALAVRFRGAIDRERRDDGSRMRAASAACVVAQPREQQRKRAEREPDRGDGERLAQRVDGEQAEVGQMYARTIPTAVTAASRA
jgi:hypothetical protein